MVSRVVTAERDRSITFDANQASKLGRELLESLLSHLDSQGALWVQLDRETS